MTTARSKSPNALRHRDPVRDGLVVLCMTVVALALGIGLHLQFALAFWLAVIAALSVYVALLSTHILVRRGEHLDQLRRELARLESRVGRMPPRAEMRPGPSPAVAGSMAAPVKAATTPAERNISLSGSAEPQPGTVANFEDYWNFSPKTNAAAPQPAAPPATMAQPTMAPAGPTPPKPQRDADIDQINAVIKKLAADITQGQAALAYSANTEASGGARAELGRPVADIDESVAALHAAADAMRHSGKAFEPGLPESDVAAPAPAQSMPLRPSFGPPPVPQKRSMDPARDRLAAIADALENERLDVMLEPILRLGDRRAQHYVVSIRLWGNPGQLAAAPDTGHVARGSGLLPLLDAVKIESAARVAWRMEDRGKPGSLFSQVSGESLVSDRFLNRFADTYRQGDTLGSRLVLSFTQGDLRTFSDPQWSTLRDMADLGFRFSLEDITDLDFDFDSLVASGFAFVKLDAGVFLDGLPAESGVIPSPDICRHVSRLGLALIVSGIADDAVAARLKSHGVELVQGPLFGVPRPVKADVLRNPHAAVA